VSLDAAAADFAGELSNLFTDVFAAQVVFEVYENPKGKDTRRLTISQRTSGGIPLNIQGQTVFRLLLGYDCSWNVITNRLTIMESSFSVYLENVKEPLWRYDFVRDMKSNIPAAHLNVHAHRDEIAWARALQPRKSFNDVRVSRLHFPFGGARFRPTIEDVIQMLIEEFNVDCLESARRTLEVSRKKFFERQLSAAVVEAPQIAINALVAAGYAVVAKSGTAAPSKLRSRKTSW
jgi:hypothetical protein